MIGINKGCIRKLEEALQRALQWVVGLINASELPLRHVFIELDGSMKSPDAFAGPLGKKLDFNVSQWPQVQSQPTLPNNVLQDLSTDQCYRYKIFWSVICGDVDVDLQLHDIGPLIHSRGCL